MLSGRPSMKPIVWAAVVALTVVAAYLLACPPTVVEVHSDAAATGSSLGAGCAFGFSVI